MNVPIQYLRGIAAVAVVFKHAAHPGGAVEHMLDAGVDLFFIISGFVMVASTHGRNFGSQAFIEKRCRRIFPMWWLTLCLVAALGLGTGGWEGFLLSFPLVPFRLQPDLGVASVFWGVGWTLVFEAIFYAYFAAGLAFKADRFIFVAIPAAVLAGALFGRSGNPLLNNLAHPLLLEFVLGALVGRLIVSGFKPSFVWVPIGLGLFVVGATISANYEIRALTLGLPLALVVAGLAAQQPSDIRVLRLLGDASYSIYLLHYVPILLSRKFVAVDSYWAVTAGAAIAVGVLAYLLVERPILDVMQAPRLKPRVASEVAR